MKFLVALLMSLAAIGHSHAESLIDKIDKSWSDHTDILAIYKKGQLIYEEFRNDYKREQKHKLWSMSKSITSLLVARAVEEGRLDVEDSLCEFVSLADLSDPNMCEITIDRLLFWQSGILWKENYVGLKGSESNVLNALYGEGIYNFSKYYLSLQYNNNIQYNWNYSTGDTHMLGFILQQVYSPMEYDNLPWAKLFDPLGITDATFERDYTGVYLGGSYIFLSHPSLNKIAQFVLQELKQPQWLPTGWFDYSLTARTDTEFSEAVKEDLPAAAIPAGHWWVNRPTTPGIQMVPWPDAPEDTFAAFGVFGQNMLIVPSLDLVVIRLGQDVKGGFDDEYLLKVAMEYAQGVEL